MTDVVVLLRSGQAVGADEVALPARTLFRMDDFAAAVAASSGASVDVQELDTGAPLPDGLLLIPSWDELDARIHDLPDDVARAVDGRTVLFRVPSSQLERVEVRPCLVGIAGNARFIQWLDEIQRPMPWTIVARRDLLTGVPPLVADVGGPFQGAHAAVDPSGLVPLPVVVGSIARSWMRSRSIPVDSQS